MQKDGEIGGHRERKRKSRYMRNPSLPHHSSGLPPNFLLLLNLSLISQSLLHSFKGQPSTLHFVSHVLLASKSPAFYLTCMY